ncbi:hypothetical protein [Streptomyces sp. NPDC047000]|uniref:hypothetical protein n=1 Tax=Streptomyces sp. NPDC047000 TaxID=3155474 RepID=UPI0033D7E711
MFQDAPIYHRLIAERGDVPARVRDAAASIRRDLEAVIRIEGPAGPYDAGYQAGRTAAAPPVQPSPQPSAAPAVLPYNALPPGRPQH